MTDIKIQEELNLDTKVTVKNIAGWDVGFARIADGNGGDVKIPPEGSARLSRNEIIAQVQNGNTLFNGVDGVGSHATIFIDDEATRREVGFDSEDGTIKQKIFSDSIVKELFNKKSQSSFESNVQDQIVTRAEKFAIIQTVKKLKLNDFSKIRFLEDYTGFKV